MTIMDPFDLDVIGEPSAASDCAGCCGSCAQPAADSAPILAGFDAAISMAEAAALHNPTRWNEIRTHAEDSAAGEYCSSVLLGALLQSAAHRLGVATADVWAHIRQTGELPL